MRKLFLVMIWLLVLQGCSSWQPWVKPYERANLADPIMNVDRDPVSVDYIAHAFKTREASRGASGGSGGGCGCN
jgi:uncharacterized protein YcfL